MLSARVCTPQPPQRERGSEAAGTLCPSPRVTAPRGEGTALGASSLCTPAGARCGLGIVRGEGPGPGGGGALMLRLSASIPRVPSWRN
jgi:hypothetical protein